MNASSSLLVALIGGPFAFSGFGDPDIETAMMAPVMLRVAIES